MSQGGRQLTHWPRIDVHAVVILPLKPNNTVPVVSKLSPQQLLEVTSDLARVCNTKHTHQVCTIPQVWI